MVHGHQHWKINQSIHSMNSSSIPVRIPGTGMQRTTPTSTNMTTTTPTTIMAGGTGSGGSSKTSQLMSKLYSKADQMKSWPELTKLMKQCLVEKRPLACDQNERIQLQKCLDTIQKNIEVKSIQSMLERLETICRQLKLKFICSNLSCFIHSEMYYVEIKFDQDGKVVDCKIDHQPHQTSTCHELIQVLRRGDFTEFTRHLEGLASIYKINTDKATKEKAYQALHALEKDLEHLAELQKSQINGINNLVHRSPVGILEPRKGGHPMKLTFFVSPYDLIDLNTKSTLPLTVDVILDRKLGYSASIGLEDSAQTHRLQVQPLFTVKQTDGKNMPQFSPHLQFNSQLLPACYALKLTKPMPICLDLAQKIAKVTSIKLVPENQEQTPGSGLISLLSKTILTQNNIPFGQNSFLTVLPDQNHCYYMNCNEDQFCDNSMQGILVEKIPFTHPTHVPRILVYLRQQALFNVILGSVIRQLNRKRDCTAYIFEISYFSLSNIYVQFEHPMQQSLATMDIDLKDITQVKCKLFATSTDEEQSLGSVGCTDDLVTKVMQKSFSIPVTMRTIINRCREAQAKAQSSKMNENPNNNAELTGSDNAIASGTTEKPVQLPQQPVISSAPGNTGSSNTSSILYQAMQQSGQNQANIKSEYYGSQEQSSLNRNKNQYLQLYCQQQQQKKQQQPGQNSYQQSSTNKLATGNTTNTMLMSMLRDVPALGIQQPVKTGGQNTNAKKRKRLSGGQESLVLGEQAKQRKLQDSGMLEYQSMIKQEPSDSNSGDYFMNSSGAEIIQISENDSCSQQSTPSVESGDDGLNEQLKIIKSLQAIRSGGNNSGKDQDARVLIKNDKFYVYDKSGGGSSIKTEDQTVGAKKKRKRTDSMENKDYMSSSSSDSLLSTGATIQPSGTPPPKSNVSAATSHLSRMLSQINSAANPTANNGSGSISPKVKKSSQTLAAAISSSGNFLPGTNRSVATSATAPGNGTSLKYSDKVLSLLNKQQGNVGNSSTMVLPKTAGTLSSMLSSSKMTFDLEHAAAMAVAANSGGSAAMAHAAAVAAVQNSLNEATSKRFSTAKNQVKKSSNQQQSSPVMVQNATGSSKSPITITVSPTSTSSSSSSQQSLIANSANRNKSVEKNSSGSLVLAAGAKQSTNASPKSSSLVSPTPGITSPKVLHSSSSLLSSSSSPSVLVKPVGTTTSAGSSAAAAAAAAAKSALGKPKKASLTSVVDRLLLKTSVTDASTGGGGAATGPSGTSSNPILMTATSPDAPVEITPSGGGGGNNSKTVNRVTSDSKAKFFRDSQFTIKQGNSGLKMSITKTKNPSGTTGSGTGNQPQSSSSASMLANQQTSAAELISKLGAPVFKSTKYTIPKIQKTTTNTTVGSSTTTTTASTGVVSSSTITSPTSSSTSTSPSANRRQSQSPMNSGKISPSPRNMMAQSPKNSGGSGNNGGGNNKSLFKSPELPPPLQQQPGGSMLPPYGATNKPGLPMMSLGQQQMNRGGNMMMNHFKTGNSGPNFPIVSSGGGWPSASMLPPSSMSTSPDGSNRVGTSNIPMRMESHDPASKALSTSTPDSPAEVSPLSVESKSPPLIIPTEAIPEEPVSMGPTGSKELSGGAADSSSTAEAPSGSGHNVGSSDQYTNEITGSLISSSSNATGTAVPVKELSSETITTTSESTTGVVNQDDA